MKLRRKKGDDATSMTGSAGSHGPEPQAGTRDGGLGASDDAASETSQPEADTNMVTTQLPAESHDEAPAQAEAQPAPAPQPQPSDGGGQGGRGPAGFFRQVWGDSAMSMNERERQAAAEFEAAIRPAKEMLVAAVPGASSPEEAAAALEPTGELVKDPNPEIPSDWFYAGDAVTFYQIRRHIGKSRAMRRNMGNWAPPPGLGSPDQIQLPPGAYGR